MDYETKEKMIHKLCKLISWYNDDLTTESYYHFYKGYLEALKDLGINIQIIRNEYIICDEKVYRIEDFK